MKVIYWYIGLLTQPVCCLEFLIIPKTEYYISKEKVDIVSKSCHMTTVRLLAQKLQRMKY
jgi:hypothetical protein